MSLTSRVLQLLVPRLGSLAPGTSSAVVHRALAHAIAGVGPLTGAVASAESHLDEASLRALRAGEPLSDTARDEAVKALVGSHLRLAAVQGFATNLGGLVTMAATVPANLAGIAIVQARLVAGIAHLGGHDLADPAVRDAVLACLLGRSTVTSLVKKGRLPGTPRQLADPPTGATTTSQQDLERIIASEVTDHLVGRVSGRGLVGLVGRRVPVLGGVVGAGADARSTHAVGRYAARELAA